MTTHLGYRQALGDDYHAREILNLIGDQFRVYPVMEELLLLLKATRSAAVKLLHQELNPDLGPDGNLSEWSPRLSIASSIRRANKGTSKFVDKTNYRTLNKSRVLKYKNSSKYPRS